MAKKERLLVPRVNFFDGQRVTEADLDDEQIYNQTITSDMVIDFHGSGIIKEPFFESRILLDTRAPGLFAEDPGNPSKLDIEAGRYDGKGISLDRQPTDAVRGNRIEFKIDDVNILGRNKTKIMVLGRAFDGIDSRGTLVAEFIEFSENGSMLSQHYYLEIISVLFNNFSGGTGGTEVELSKDSLDLISESNGYMLIKESEPLMVFPATNIASQIESPNFDMINFITSSPSRSIEDEISVALGPTNSINDLYIELIGKDQLRLEKDGLITTTFGQKFLAKTNNLQKIDLLLSVERDDDQPAGSEFDFSGDLIISIHELASDIDCPTDSVPENLIDFDPEITPILEISFSQDDLEELGYKLDDDPQIVSINFSGTLIADPNIEPSIMPNKFYAFMVRRSGDNRTGTIVLEKGFDKVAGKLENNVELTTFEQFAKQTSKFFEFDPVTKRYINDSNCSLWFKVHADAVEVTDGTAYSDTGVAITVPKTEKFVGGAEISRFENGISLRTVRESASNYIWLSHVNEFVSPNVHPRTGNFVFTRILNGASVSAITQDELGNLLKDTFPLLLGRVKDNNVRDAQVITGTAEKPGLVGVDSFTILDPGADLLNANLINRIFTPDTECECSARYRIVGVDCVIKKAGDLDGDGVLTTNDINKMINIVGNTINSEVTERAILGGEIDVIDFLKADLDANDTIDGIDIELLEDAIDGYVNFTVPEETKCLVLRLENVLSEDDFPTIFTDTASSGETVVGSNEVRFIVTENVALAVRPGDLLEVPAPSVDAGVYEIITKAVAEDGVSLTLTVAFQDEAEVSFSGDVDLDFTITSGTAVNTYHDNPNLMQVPYQATNYEISFVDAPFEGRFIDICDLRRFVGINFIEEKGNDPCDCEEQECLPEDDCLPDLRNQTIVPGDLFLPSGKLMESPGVPYHGDFEYANITVPMPPGSISNCSVDLYNSFIKAGDDGCLTAAGFPAMKFSDGTYVGCEDSGDDTDLTKGRVKISHAICSLFVDGLVEDDTIDGYADAEESASNSEAISENYLDDSFSSFDLWTEDPGNNVTITNISHPAGINQPAVFDINTSGDSGERFGRLNAPLSAQNFAGDFIVDFTAARTVWEETDLTNGIVLSFATFIVSNTDGSSATLKLGWKIRGGMTTKIFYSGVIEDASMTVTSTFDFEIEAPDSLGDEVLFRLRRTNDVINAYYIVPSKLSEVTEGTFGQYVRIGENLAEHPGDGSTTMSFEIAQNNAPTAGLSYFTRLSEVIILSEYTSDALPATVPIGRDAATKETNRGTFTFPLNLTSRTSVVSAYITLTAADSGTSNDLYNVIPIDVLNADNLGPIFNLPITQNATAIQSFVPGTFAVGDEITVDVTTTIITMLAETGHLPGQIKALSIEPDLTADSDFNVSSSAFLTIEYEDSTSGIIFKVGVSLDPATGIASFSTKNILYDSIIEENRTVINFGVYLKKAGFKNNDVNLNINELQKVGIGLCIDEDTFTPEEECFFIAGSTATGVFVEGPFPCQFHLP